MKRKIPEMQWPVKKILSSMSKPPGKLEKAEFAKMLAGGGYGKSLSDFLFGLYEHANGGLFYDGAFRVTPIQGFIRHHMPGLVEWNDPKGWRQMAPKNGRNAFYFCSNAFGDQFGVPIDAKGGLARDRLIVLWVEKCIAEEAAVGWMEALPAFLADKDDVGKYLARLKEYKWAAAELGKPQPWECFSSKVPKILGGDDTVDNVEIRSLGVHVSFMLQVIQQSRKS